MTQIAKKWISDRAIDNTKLDSSYSYTMAGLSIKNGPNTTLSIDSSGNISANSIITNQDETNLGNITIAQGSPAQDSTWHIEAGVITTGDFQLRQDGVGTGLLYLDGVAGRATIDGDTTVNGGIEVGGPASVGGNVGIHTAPSASYSLSIADLGNMRLNKASTGSQTTVGWYGGGSASGLIGSRGLVVQAGDMSNLELRTASGSCNIVLNPNDPSCTISGKINETIDTSIGATLSVYPQVNNPVSGEASPIGGPGFYYTGSETLLDAVANIPMSSDSVSVDIYDNGATFVATLVESVDFTVNRPLGVVILNSPIGGIGARNALVSYSYISMLPYVAFSNDASVVNNAFVGNIGHVYNKLGVGSDATSPVRDLDIQGQSSSGMGLLLRNGTGSSASFSVVAGGGGGSGAGGGKMMVKDEQTGNKSALFHDATVTSECFEMQSPIAGGARVVLEKGSGTESRLAADNNLRITAGGSLTLTGSSTCVINPNGVVSFSPTSNQVTFTADTTFAPAVGAAVRVQGANGTAVRIAQLAYDEFALDVTSKSATHAAINVENTVSGGLCLYAVAGNNRAIAAVNYSSLSPTASFENGTAGGQVLYANTIMPNGKAITAEASDPDGTAIVAMGNVAVEGNSSFNTTAAGVSTVKAISSGLNSASVNALANDGYAIFANNTSAGNAGNFPTISASNNAIGGTSLTAGSYADDATGLQAYAMGARGAAIYATGPTVFHGDSTFLQGSLTSTDTTAIYIRDGNEINFYKRGGGGHTGGTSYIQSNYGSSSKISIVINNNTLATFSNDEIDYYCKTAYGDTYPDSTVGIKGANGYTQLRLYTSFTPTGTADIRGYPGVIAWDDNFIYIMTNGGWKQAALSSF